MALMDKVQGLLQKVKTRKPDEQPQLVSNRANGGFSGYQPKITRQKPVQNVQADHPATGFFTMMPGGVDPNVMQQFQPVGGQTGAVPPQQMQQGQPMPQGRPMAQPHARQATGYQQPVQQQMPPVQQMQPMQQMQPVQPVQPAQGSYQPRHQGAPQQMGQTGWQQTYPPQQPAQPAQPRQNPGDNLCYFPGYQANDGSLYRMVLRVAQITGVSSCYRLIEFMQNGEATIVNAEQISDPVEADRCMDLLFGAAYAMNQNFVRISGKLIYLIAPRQMQVEPFDGLLRMSNDDIERRWPGANRSAQQERAAFGGFAAQPRQDDFAPQYGARAARSPQAGAYTDFGGYSVRR